MEPDESLSRLRTILKFNRFVHVAKWSRSRHLYIICTGREKKRAGNAFKKYVDAEGSGLRGWVGAIELSRALEHEPEKKCGENNGQRGNQELVLRHRSRPGRNPGSSPMNVTRCARLSLTFLRPFDPRSWKPTTHQPIFRRSPRSSSFLARIWRLY